MISRCGANACSGKVSRQHNGSFRQSQLTGMAVFENAFIRSQSTLLGPWSPSSHPRNAPWWPALLACRRNPPKRCRSAMSHVPVSKLTPWRDPNAVTLFLCRVGSLNFWRQGTIAIVCGSHQKRQQNECVERIVFATLPNITPNGCIAAQIAH